MMLTKELFDAFKDALTPKSNIKYDAMLPEIKRRELVRQDESQESKLRRIFDKITFSKYIKNIFFPVYP